MASIARCWNGSYGKACKVFGIVTTPHCIPNSPAAPRPNRLGLVLCALLLAGAPGAWAERRGVLEFLVPADHVWTETPVAIVQGIPLRIEATGAASMVGARLWEWMSASSVDRAVGPQGTYVWPRRYKGRRPGAFPLPTMGDGPAPAFCLIGKIGKDGEPFYLGARYEGIPQRSGRLWLGVNDDHPDDNRGRFLVAVEHRPDVALSPGDVVRPRITPSPGRPVPHARVVLLYVDGLRADVLLEMAQAGFLPNFSKTFIRGGLQCPNAFTVFPSNTLIANGSLFTGFFPDRTGIKSQNQFERATLKTRGQLSRWLPDGFIRRPDTQVINLLDKYAPENTHSFLVSRRVPTLSSRLGTAYQFTTLPIVPLNPPPYWFHEAINTIGPFGLPARLPRKVDRVNAQYTVDYILDDPSARVIAVWFPMVDKTSHTAARGQFGSARRDLALVDRDIGEILARLHEKGWSRSTYFILVSDHGHLGGERGVNRACNLPRDWAHRQLGCNVQVVGQEWMHPGLDPKRFVFFDNQGAGQAALFLPSGDYLTGPWRRNSLYGLTHYTLRPNRAPVNLVESLERFRPPGWDGRGERPIDLILIKLDGTRILMRRAADNEAIIHREPDEDGRERYRYEPIRHVTQSADGRLQMLPALPEVDPLGYLRSPEFLSEGRTRAWLEAPHTTQEWLDATYRTRYPDAVVTMAKFFAWSPGMADLAEVRDPDLLVTASEGWSFRSDDLQGTDHGYPLADSMRISLFIAGPNIRRGILPEPRRIVDVLPTMLEMIGEPYEAEELDGRAIKGIYGEE